MFKEILQEAKKSKKFNTDDVFGKTMYAIVSDGDMYDLETGEVAHFNPNDIFYARSKQYDNFLFKDKKSAEKMIKKEWDYDGKVEVLPVQVRA